jgi:hypothetical protein
MHAFLRFCGRFETVTYSRQQEATDGVNGMHSSVCALTFVSGCFAFELIARSTSCRWRAAPAALCTDLSMMLLSALQRSCSQKIQTANHPAFAMSPNLMPELAVAALDGALPATPSKKSVLNGGHRGRPLHTGMQCNHQHCDEMCNRQATQESACAHL